MWTFVLISRRQVGRGWYKFSRWRFFCTIPGNCDHKFYFSRIASAKKLSSLTSKILEWYSLISDYFFVKLKSKENSYSSIERCYDSENLKRFKSEQNSKLEIGDWINDLRIINPSWFRRSLCWYFRNVWTHSFARTNSWRRDNASAITMHHLLKTV